jgi:hypothetical protein
MIDVFHAIAACDGLIRYWDVAKHPEGGVLVRLTSASRQATEQAAVAVAHMIAERVQPDGYDVRTVSAVARTHGETDGDTDGGWHGFVEVVIA